MTPAEAVTKTVSATAPNENRGVQQYTAATGSATQVDIQLFPAANMTDTDGVITFADTNSDNVADPGSPVGSITVVNGVGNTGTRANNVTPSGGSVTFTLNSDAGGSSVPVVFTDSLPTSAGDNQLQLTVPTTANANRKAPAEAFGIGGAITWTPIEFVGGAFEIAAPGLTTVNKDANYFIGNVTNPATGSRTLDYDSNDNFQIGGVPTTLAIWEANLSKGDTMLTGSVYAPDPSLVSTFNLGDVSPTAPAGALVAAGLTDTTVKVDWAAVTGANSYNVYRQPDPTDNIENDTCVVPDAAFTGWTKVGTVAAPTVTFTDTGLTATTTYCYFVTTVTDGDESVASDTDDAKTLTTGATASPQSDDVRILSDSNFPGEASPTDTWRVLFSEPMGAIDTTDVIRVQDGNGEFRNAVCGSGELTCWFNASPVTVGSTTYATGQVLTVTVSTIGTLSDNDGNLANNNGVLDYPLTITTQNGFVDQDSPAKPWVPSTSPDNVIDVETGTVATTQIAPSVTTVADTQDGAFATATATDGDGDVSYTADNIGSSGSSIVVEIVNFVGSPTDMTVQVVGTGIRVELADDGDINTPGTITSTASQVADAINAHGGASALVDAAVVTAGVVAAEAEALAGGEDIVLTLTWSEAVNGGVTAGNFQLETVAATVAATVVSSTTTTLTWDNVPLNPVANGDILAVANAAVADLDANPNAAASLTRTGVDAWS